MVSGTSSTWRPELITTRGSSTSAEQLAERHSWLNDDYTAWPLARIAQQQGGGGQAVPMANT